MSDLGCNPLISWCSVKYPLVFNSVSVTYSSGIEVMKPLSLFNCDTLVGILLTLTWGDWLWA